MAVLHGHVKSYVTDTHIQVHMTDTHIQVHSPYNRLTIW